MVVTAPQRDRSSYALYYSFHRNSRCRRLRVDVLLPRASASLVHAASADAPRPPPLVLRSRRALDESGRLARWLPWRRALSDHRGAGLAHLVARGSRRPRAWDRSTSGGATPPTLAGGHQLGFEASCDRSPWCSPRTTTVTTETPRSSSATSSASTMRRLGRFWRGSHRRAAGRAMPAGAQRGG